MLCVKRFQKIIKDADRLFSVGKAEKVDLNRSLKMLPGSDHRLSVIVQSRGARKMYTDDE